MNTPTIRIAILMSFLVGIIYFGYQLEQNPQQPVNPIKHTELDNNDIANINESNNIAQPNIVNKPKIPLRKNMFEVRLWNVSSKVAYALPSGSKSPHPASIANNIPLSSYFEIEIQSEKITDVQPAPKIEISIIEPPKPQLQPKPDVSKPNVSKISVAPLPSLDFIYLGNLKIEDQSPQVFLEAHNKIISMKKGEILDTVYQIQSISDSTITLLYVPDGRTTELKIQE